MKRGNTILSVRFVHALQILLVVLLAIALNVVAVGLSRRYPLSFDLTANDRYTLSDENKAFLSSLDKDVTISVLGLEEAFSRASTYTNYAAILLAEYPKYGPVTVEYVDFQRDPTFAARYPDLTLSENGLVIACEDRATTLNVSDLFNYSYSSANEIQVSAIGEARLAGAISDVLHATHARATVLTGNGAQSVDGLRALLQANGFEVEERSLAMADFDAESDVLILVAPTADMTEEQISALETYLENGGRYGKVLFYAADVTQGELANLEGFLREWGISVDDGAVFETSADRTSQNQPFFATVEIVNAALSEDFADAGAPVVAPMARPLTVRFAFQENYATETLLQFSETSGVRPSDAAEGFTAADATRRGPIPALVKSTLTPPGESASEIYVCAAASLLDSTILEGNAFLNKRFLIKLFSQFGESADVSNFVGKNMTDATVHIPTSTANSLGVVLAIVLPLALIALGILFFLRRRRL